MPPKDLPFVSVIIPHKGDDAGLIQCLNALRNQTYPSSSFEVIVVRNELHDRPAPLSLRGNARFLWEPQGFSYAARNLGVAHALGEILAFTDSDTVPSPSWIEQGIQAFAGNMHMVAGRILLEENPRPLNWSACYEYLYSFNQEGNVKNNVSTTANLFVLREIFQREGPFFQGAITGEDFEWVYRATQSGASLAYNPLATVAHPVRSKFHQLVSKVKRTSLVSAQNLGRNVSLTQTKRLFMVMKKSPVTDHMKLTRLEMAKGNVLRILLLTLQLGLVVTSRQRWRVTTGLGGSR